jgi:hypothetical protein
MTFFELAMVPGFNFLTTIGFKHCSEFWEHKHQCIIHDMPVTICKYRWPYSGARLPSSNQTRNLDTTHTFDTALH